MQYRSVVAAIAAATLAYAQDAPPNITDALASTEDLSTLNTLVGQYPDLVTTLANATNITIFAPSNSALETAMGNELFTQLSEADMGFVMNLLTYHVINGTYMAANFSETPAFVRTLLTNETYTQVSGGQRVGLKTIGEEAAVLSGLGFRANVTQPDIMIANGVVHIVDGILFPPLNASTTALAANLTALVGAVIATNLTEVVDTTPDITIFAPTTEAFEDIGSILANLSVEDAAALLQYHIINGTVAYSSLLANGTSVDSASGQPLNITIEDGEVFVNSARVIAADVLVANGVVHVIDAVLNPNSTLAADPDNDDGVPAFEGAEDGDVPYTSGIPAATGTPVVMTTDAVADGYTPAASDALSTAAEETAAQASETSSALAAKITGAVGAAALFGGAAFVAAL